jgi:DNA topoisomerase-1
VEEGAFKIKGYDGPTLSCHKCGSDMQLKTGRFGKYFGCMNDNCGATRALQRNGEPKPIVMEPIITEIPCIKFEDNYLLRDSMKGLFFAASQYPKNRETRAPSVEEFNQVVTEETLLDACKYLEDQAKHTHLLDAPKKDIDGNPYIIRYNKAEDTHYLASEKDGKKTGNTATYNGQKWVEVSK